MFEHVRTQRQLVRALRAWADGETTTSPAELDAACRAVIAQGMRAALGQE
jgi:hypothetical protein